MIFLREASEDDVGHLIQLGREMHQESAFNFLLFDEKMVKNTAFDYIRKNNACVFLVFNDTKCIGMHVGSLTSYFFCDALLAAGLVTYVHPKYRGGRAALLLMRAFIDWSKNRDVAEVYIGVSVDINAKQSHKLFQHFGFHYVGGNYKLRLV